MSIVRATSLVLLLCVAVSCSEEREEPRAPVVIHFECAISGTMIEIDIDPDDPVPALLLLSDRVVRTCQPVVGNSFDQPVVLTNVHGSIGPIPAKEIERELNTAQGTITVTTTTTVSGIELVQTGPDRFSWTFAGRRGLPGNLGDLVPHETVSVPHATQALACYFGQLFKTYEIVTTPLMELSEEERRRLDDEVTERNRSRVKEWVLRIRDHHRLKDDGRSEPPPTEGQTAPAPAPPSAR